MLYTKKQMERECERRMAEYDENRWRAERMEALGRRIDKIECELFELRMKVDPEFKVRNVPVCGETGCEKPIA